MNASTALPGTRLHRRTPASPHIALPGGHFDSVVATRVSATVHPGCWPLCDAPDVPKVGWESHWHAHPGVRSGDELTLGERSADRMRNAMGSWPFVGGFFAIMALWVVVNTVFIEHVLHHKAFDPYPYILLNLFLSMLAGVQAAALLIAAKRADAISSEIALHTERNTDDIKTLIAENTALTNEVKAATDLLNEIHLHVANIGKAVGARMGKFAPGDQPGADAAT
jgi:uncharacterized membrane protein